MNRTNINTDNMHVCFLNMNRTNINTDNMHVSSCSPPKNVNIPCPRHFGVLRFPRSAFEFLRAPSGALRPSASRSERHRETQPSQLRNRGRQTGKPRSKQILNQCPGKKAKHKKKSTRSLQLASSPIAGDLGGLQLQGVTVLGVGNFEQHSPGQWKNLGRGGEKTMAV